MPHERNKEYGSLITEPILNRGGGGKSMEAQQLEFVLAAMKADSFAQAARKCYTSRQNISHAVKATEREFGVVLFKRENKKLVLTEDGKI